MQINAIRSKMALRIESFSTAQEFPKIGGISKSGAVKQFWIKLVVDIAD